MNKDKIFVNYLRRYVSVHVVVYVVVGLIFMNLMNYEELFKTNVVFSNFRPMDSPIVRATILFQILRGLMFALILYPFRERIVNSKWGWLMLFFVLYGFTCLGAINATPGSIEGFIYTKVSLRDHLNGMPEVIVQSLGIATLFWWWERRKTVLLEKEIV